MKTIEIIRNSVMQCIERIEKLSKSVEKVDNSMKLQEQNIENGKIYDSVMYNFVTSQFKNFTYIYYTENGEIKSILFNDGNVFKPNVPNYTISGKPVSYICFENTSKVVFKDFDTSSVANMSSMFYNCSNLTTLDLSNFDTSSVANMSSMFYNCSNITTLDLSNFDTSSVTNMGSMFYSCENLTTLDVSNFNTSSVTDMSYMFSYCSNLTTLDLSNFDTSAVTDMSVMFGFCSNLTTLDLSNFDTSAVTDTRVMFGSCRNLTSIIGTHTLEEVQAGTVKAMRGLKVSISFSDSPNLERASILALFYGLADLTGKTKQNVELHATAKARLTAEDIKIATDKNWNVQ